MRNVDFVENEYYHVYNRGVEKRVLFEDQNDFKRFLISLQHFNTKESIGSIYELSFRKRLGSLATKSEPLVEFVAYCVNPNHYHFLLRQVSDGGITKFMHRLGAGYTRYFNERHKRSGSLFQGPFKAIHVDSNEYLLHLSAYINLNWKVHQLGSLATKLVKSSWEEYIGENKESFCEKRIILDQFRNDGEYKEFAVSSLESIVQRKEVLKGIADFLLE